MPSISEDLFQQAMQCIPGGVNSPVRAFRSVAGTPFFTQSAQGPLLTTADGQELIDFVCTWGPAIHGHNDPTIREAIGQALARGTSFGTPSPAEVTMAELICQTIPSVEKVRMCNSGTEATMSAIRLARGHTGRNKIIKFAGCYHGHVDSLLVQAGSGALTLGTPDSAGIPADLAALTLVLPYNDPTALTATFAEHGDDLAAVIIEPYPANCGLILPQAGYLQTLRELCTQYGTVLIFDEVMTGFRVAAGGVQEREHITPDLTAMGKIIGGGLPVGAFGGKTAIMDQLAPLGPVYQAGTLSGNPLAMAAGITAVSMLKQQQPYHALEQATRQIQEALLQAASRKGIALQVPTAPSMFCLYFAEEPISSFAQATASATELFNKVFHYSLQEGVYLPPSPYETCFLSTHHHGSVLEKACQVLSDAIANL